MHPLRLNSKQSYKLSHQLGSMQKNEVIIPRESVYYIKGQCYLMMSAQQPTLPGLSGGTLHRKVRHFYVLLISSPHCGMKLHKNIMLHGT